MRDKRRDKWLPLYNFLRQQQPGTIVAWRVLSEVAGHDTRATRSALHRARIELAKDGLTYGNQSPAGLEVMSL